MGERLKSLPSSLRFLLLVGVIAFNVVNSFKHFVPDATAITITASVLTAMGYDTIRPIGKSGGIDISGLIKDVLDALSKGSGNGPNPPTPSPAA